MVVIFMQPSFSWELFSVLLFMLGVCLAAQFLCFSIVSEINPSNLSATAGGLQNMLCMCSGVIFQPLVGKLLHGGAAHQVATSQEYLVALSVLPLCTLLAMLLPFLMRETYGKRA